ncbi:MAG: CYTH domain-containing protein [Bacteroidales bacterium]|nr:CYTH domain-containing protein [Bacteroidales bacterium]
MNREIERKFLVTDEAYKAEAVESHRLVQGYICRSQGRTVRVRIADGTGWLTIKGPSESGGLARSEWEKEIPLEDAQSLMSLCEGGVIDKTRWIVPEAGGLKYEVDEFLGQNRGLVVAEIELPSEDAAFVPASWLGREVTGDRRFYNSMLVSYPFCKWPELEKATVAAAE